jgi:hypothetical protein
MAQTVQVVRSSIPAPVDLTQIAHQYVASQLGVGFTVGKFRLIPAENKWWALIQYRATAQKHPVGLGRIQIDARTDSVISLTRNEIAELREKSAILEAQLRGELPVDEQGIVLREYARK